MPLSSKYLENVIISKGALSLDSEMWTDMILRRSVDLPGAVIEKVEHYKCTDGFKHKYLAIHIKHPLNNAASGRKIVIFVERTVTPGILNLFLSSPTSPPPVPANNIISISSPDVPDPIQFITDHHKTHVLISTLQFNKKTPTDTDLSKLLSVLYDVFKDLFESESMDANDVKKRGHFGMVLAPSKDKWVDLKARFQSSTRVPETKPPAQGKVAKAHK